MKKILFIINNYNYFETHKKEFIIKLSKEYNVLIAIPKNTKKINSINNINFIKYNFSRKINPLTDIISLYQIYKIVKNFKPDIVHSFTIKPIIFTNILSFIIKMKIINNFSGLGILFSKKSISLKFLKFIFIIIIKLFNRNINKVITQTNFDKKILIKNSLFLNNTFHIVPGSGVIVNKNIVRKNLNNNKHIILLATRLLKQKGIDTFCELSNICKLENIEFHLIGDIDLDNPDSLTLNEINYLIDHSRVKWFGFQKDTSLFYKNCDIFCFPSVYGEGIPKSILEASSYRRPVVAFDNVGLDEIIIDNHNGYLIEKKNIKKMLDRIIFLCLNPEIKEKLGNNAELMIRKKYSLDIINTQMLEIHKNF